MSCQSTQSHSYLEHIVRKPRCPCFLKLGFPPPAPGPTCSLCLVLRSLVLALPVLDSALVLSGRALLSLVVLARLTIRDGAVAVVVGLAGRLSLLRVAFRGRLLDRLVSSVAEHDFLGCWEKRDLGFFFGGRGDEDCWCGGEGKLFGYGARLGEMSGFEGRMLLCGLRIGGMERIYEMWKVGLSS